MADIDNMPLRLLTYLILLFYKQHALSRLFIPMNLSRLCVNNIETCYILYIIHIT